MLHFRADYPTLYTPCRESVQEVQATSDRDDVTCSACLAALVRADERVTDPERRGL